MIQRLLILSLAACGFAVAGCSTPAATDGTYSNSSSTGETAYQSYLKCLQNLPVGWDASYCNGVKSSKAMSYETFTAGAQINSEDDTHELYKNYLQTVDSDSLSSMSQQWNKKAAE